MRHADLVGLYTLLLDCVLYFENIPSIAIHVFKPKSMARENDGRKRKQHTYS